MEWPGKREAIVTANIPTTKTLRPIREDSVDFDTTQNLYIEGDNLEVLKLLQESYLNKIKMIYIDPPYNTGKDFVYKDNFTQDSEEYKEESGLLDEAKNRLVVNLETDGRYHSDWLSMMYSRLKLARNLLKNDGVILLSIDDYEAHNLKKLCDEIYGENNFAGVFVIRSTPNARNYGNIAKMHEYCFMYCKNIEDVITFELEEEEKEFKYKDEKGEYNLHPLYNSDESFHSGNRRNLYYPFYLNVNSKDENGFYKISTEKSKEFSQIVYPPLSSKNKVQFVWRWSKQKSEENLNIEIVGHIVESGEFRISRKMRHTSKIVRSMLLETEFSGRNGTAEVEKIFNSKIFSFPKPIALLKTLFNVALGKEDIALDFFSGSATTSHAVMQLNAEDGGNRKFILVQVPETTDEKSEAYKAGYTNICEIGKERIRRAGKKIKESLNQDSQDVKIKQDAVDKKNKVQGLASIFDEENITAQNQVNPTHSENIDSDKRKNQTADKLDIGFRVYRLADSNMKDMYYRPQDFIQDNLDLFEDNIKADRTPDDLLTQVLLDWGLPLSLSIEQLTIADKQVFKVAENSLFACFDSGIDEAFAKELATYKPMRVVFRDKSFKDNSAKENVKQLLKQLSVETEMKVI